MTTVISFESWVEQNQVPLPSKREFCCHACEGTKKQISDKTGKEINCRTCQGHGLISGRKTLFDPRKDLYTEAVISDLRRYCGWAGKDAQPEIDAFTASVSASNQKNGQPILSRAEQTTSGATGQS